MVPFCDYFQMWIMFSPIADITAAYYNIDASQVNWLSLSYMVVSIPVGFVAMWALDTKSLKKLVTCFLICVIAHNLQICPSKVEVYNKIYTKKFREDLFFLSLNCRGINLIPCISNFF